MTDKPFVDRSYVPGSEQFTTSRDKELPPQTFVLVSKIKPGEFLATCSHGGISLSTTQQTIPLALITIAIALLRTPEFDEFA